MSDIRLSGRVALVTGANQGIGAATARRLAARGAAVLVTYLRAAPAAHRGDPAFPPEYDHARATGGAVVVEAIRTAGGRAEEVECDLADPLAPGRLFDRAEDLIGPVEILVNNASGWLADTFRPDHRDRLGRPLRPVDAAGFDRQFAVDARAPALLIAEFARRHVERGASWGRIIGLTSGGPRGFPEEVSYGAAKAAQENYTMAAAQELAPYGITANIVYPPVTDTGWLTDETAEAIGRDRIAEPDEVAEVIVWLASNAARRVTGQLIRLT